MATKPKTTENTAHAPEASLDAMFSKALQLFTDSKLEEAKAAFEAVQDEAIKQERLNMGRSAKAYLAGIRGRLEDRNAAAPEAAELAAQVRLNAHKPEEALALLEKALPKAAGKADLHYLIALAHAQMDQFQASADALAKALELKPDLIFQYRLEPDFDGLRHAAPFAAFLQV